MKYSIIILVFLLINYVYSYAQKIDNISIADTGSILIESSRWTIIPDVAKDSFKVKFPAATKVTWTRVWSSVMGENKMLTGVCEVHFELDNRKQFAQFDPWTGQWIKTGVDISSNKLPKRILKSIKKSYVGYKIIESQKIEMSKYKHAYELRIIRGNGIQGNQILDFAIRILSGGRILMVGVMFKSEC